MPEARRRARERRRDRRRRRTTFSARVLRRQAPAVERVVERRDRLAQLPEAGDGRVLLIVDVDRDVVDARRRAGELARLGLPLAEVAPLGVARREAALCRLGRDVDDAGSRDGAEGVERVFFAHGSGDVSTWGWYAARCEQLLVVSMWLSIAIGALVAGCSSNNATPTPAGPAADAGADASNPPASDASTPPSDSGGTVTPDDGDIKATACTAAPFVDFTGR